MDWTGKRFWIILHVRSITLKDTSGSATLASLHIIQTYSVCCTNILLIPQIKSKEKYAQNVWPEYNYILAVPGYD